MDEIEILEFARRLIEEYGQDAEHEVEERAVLALIREDMEDYDLWARVVVFVSEINSRE
jgi:hypothetical protein